MLVCAKAYEDQIQAKMQSIWYDTEYQYYFEDSGRMSEWKMCFGDRMHFASVDDNGNLIGYITYAFSRDVDSCFCFGAMNFERGKTNRFALDLGQAIHDIFFKYNFTRMDFSCFSNNPALQGYRAFIKRYGGREVGTFYRSTKSLDGTIQNTVMFEILKEDLIQNTKSDSVEYKTRLERDFHKKDGVMNDFKRS